MVFFEFLTPFTRGGGGGDFFISNLFSMIHSVLDAPRRGLKVFFWTPKATKPSPS